MANNRFSEVDHGTSVKQGKGKGGMGNVDGREGAEEVKPKGVKSFPEVVDPNVNSKKLPSVKGAEGGY